jgi:hypothetical protein
VDLLLLIVENSLFQSGIGLNIKNFHLSYLQFTNIVNIFSLILGDTMKHLLVLLSLFLFLQSQSFRFSVGGQLNAYIKQKEEQGVGPFQQTVEKPSLANFIENAAGLTFGAKVILNNTVALGIRHFRSSHEFGSVFNGFLPSDSRLLVTSWMPNISIGRLNENGTYFYGFGGINIESYELIVNISNIEIPELLKSGTNFVLGLGVDFQASDSSPIGISFDASFQLGSTKAGAFFNGTPVASDKIHSNAFRIGASIYYAFGSVEEF